MAARPRIRRRANWPANLHEPRPGYYTWRDPRDGSTYVLGRIDLALAIFEANEANVKAAGAVVTKTLAERLDTPKETVADLLLRMPIGKAKPETIRHRKYVDNAIREEIGTVKCGDLTTKHIADMLEKIEARGKMQWSVHVRSRMKVLCRRGKALGWMKENPATDTERATVTVKRRRLTFDEFQRIYEKAPEVASWLQNAMLLALVSGQDRSTVARWERGFQQDGYAVLTRGKTGVRIAIPLELQMEKLGMSLADVIAKCRTTGIVSKYLIHHIRPNVNAPKGSAIKIKTFTAKFKEARDLAGITGDDAPTFHEIRSLTKRLYMEQGNVDTKALLGHMTDAVADLYANSRGIEPMRVKIGSK
jgi:integrase